MRRAWIHRLLIAIAFSLVLGSCSKSSAPEPVVAQDDPLPPPTAASPETQAVAIAAANDPSVPSSQPEPPRAMRGVFTVAPDRETFRECGKTTTWWVVADDATLQPLRQRAAVKAESTHTPAPSIYVELTGELLGTQGSAGFANDYRNVVKLGAVTRIDENLPPACVAN